MKNRRLLHGLSLMFRIKNNKAPSYLCKRIRGHNEIHGHFTRNRNNIDPPFARTKIRSMSFFIFMCKKFNEIANCINIGNISYHTFKIKTRKYLLEQQQYPDFSLYYSCYILFFIQYCFYLLNLIGQFYFSFWPHIFSILPRTQF